ncbi:MAG TPA: hypothetical protein VFV78_05440, partial [Vicinamibacterales bacterium]|nr:hypothetical protein [Vicinamibacterales bacterium]
MRDRLRRSSRRTTHSVVMLIVVATTSMIASSRSPFDAPGSAFGSVGMRAERGYFSAPIGNVDMVNGDLRITQTDLVLPGNAGMSLRIGRTYRLQTDNAFKWTFDYGLGGVPMYIDIPTSDPPSMVMFDGTTQKLHSGIESGYWISTEFWRFHASSRTLYLTNGWVATYDAPDTNLTAAWLHEVHDPYGNSLTPAWNATTGPRRPTSVTQQVDDSGGTHTRTVTFGGSSPQPSSMSYDGRTWTFAYESSSPYRLTTVDPPAGANWEFSYGSTSMTVTNPGGGTVAFDFTSGETPTVYQVTTGGRAISSGTWTFGFSSSGSSATGTVATPDSRTITYEHDWTDGPDGKLWTLHTRSLSHGSTIAVDTRTYTAISFDGKSLQALESRVLSQDGLTFTTAYEYHSTSYGDYLQPYQITESASNHSATRVTTRTFHTFSFGDFLLLPRVDAETVAIGTPSYSTSVEYDSTGFVISRTAGGITMDFSRDDFGNPNGSTDPGNHTTSVEYQWGVAKNTNTPEYSIFRNINEDGTVHSDKRGYWGPVTYYTYDDLGRITSSSPPDSTSIVTTYASDGSAVTVTRGVSWVTTTVDGFGRPIATENAEGVKTTAEFDNIGRKIFQSAPFTGSAAGGNAFSYDDLGRVTAVTHTADDSAVTYSYAGTDVTITDENNHSTTQHWQAFGAPGNGRLAGITDADEQEWAYTYNVFGSLTGVATPNGPDRSWTYNSDNQLESETQPESGTTSYTYNSDGLLASKTDALSQTTTFGYDANHRLTSVNAPGTSDDVAFTYDGSDNRLTATASGSSTTFSYDNAHRLVSRADVINGHTFTTGFEYDGRDNLTKITYPSGRAIQYNYDYANRITQVYSGTTVYADDLAYHATGALSGATFGNDTTETLTLNSRFRPEHLTSGPLDVTYTYDAAGNVSAIDDARSGFDSGFEYDHLDRLIEATGYGAGTFDYDAQGNRTAKSVQSGSVTYTYSSTTNRLTSASGSPETSSFSYDAAGNLTAEASATYTYTSRNQMASATVSSAATNYTYDADGLRAIKATTSQTTYYVHGLGSLVLAEYQQTSGTPALQREYVYLGSRLLASLVPDDDEPEAIAAVTGITTSAGSITAGGSVTATVSGVALPCAQVKMTWGDGSSASYPLSSPYALPIAPNHTYTSAGLYTIVAEGESGCGGKVSIPVEVRSAQIITNGDFSGGNNATNTAPANWDFYADGSGVTWGLAGYLGFFRASDSTYAVLEQLHTMSLPAGAPLEASFKLGNTDAAFGRQIFVYIRSSDWSDRALCTFYVPAYASLTTYTMRTHTNASWSGVVLDFYAIDSAASPYQIDDVSLIYAPANSSA